MAVQTPTIVKKLIKDEGLLKLILGSSVKAGKSEDLRNLMKFVLKLQSQGLLSFVKIGANMRHYSTTTFFNWFMAFGPRRKDKIMGVKVFEFLHQNSRFNRLLLSNFCPKHTAEFKKFVKPGKHLSHGLTLTYRFPTTIIPGRIP